MILIDAPMEGRNGKRYSQLVSDKPLFEGQAELIRFAIRMKMDVTWMRHKGTGKECFMLGEWHYRKALEAGAVLVDTMKLCEVIRKKCNFGIYRRTKLKKPRRR